ncbi:serine hydrolase domain-containing protein [Flavobacterium litorale]|uniref:Beta-lactamase family protein n=1 Tax=Flavobacterium litorale TaxID=2856519 RepID=A0ABX8V6N8_9FLAO|nr:serine hydrolase domain-containing protein [Flavobacterium litorale]QYJ67778.1 beta-lactamase family protein [Flavobacterium litorale]
MKFTKILPYIFIVLLFSCKEEKPMFAEHIPAAKVVDTMPRLSPLRTKLNKVSTAYKNLKISKIERFVKKTWRRNDLSGGFLVAKNGEILYESYGGLANKNTKQKIDSRTALHVASVSKVLTATVVLKLIDEGKLQLDQKVNTVLKTFPYDNITVKMLLTHRSGLPKYEYFTYDEKIWDGSMLTNKDILDLMATHKIDLYFRPDRKFGYCNTNYAMLALVIEKLTGMNYRDAMQEILFKPLGMNDTYVFDYDKHKESASMSYKGNNVLYDFDFLDNIYGDKNIYSTPRDLLKFDLATYSDDFLSPELTEQIYKGYSYERRGIKNYGLGIRLNEWKSGEKMAYHNGWWHGNTSSYITLKKDTVAIIALSNKFSKKPYGVYKLAPEFGSYPIKKWR